MNENSQLLETIQRKIEITLFWERKIASDNRFYENYVIALIELGQLYLEHIKRLDSIQAQLIQSLQEKIERFELKEKLSRYYMKLAFMGIEDEEKAGDSTESESSESSGGSTSSLTKKNKKYLSHAHYHESLLKKFHFGLFCLDRFFQHQKPSREELAQEYPQSNVLKTDNAFLQYEKFEILSASKAIQSYKPADQKFLTGFSHLLSFLAALGCGFLIAVTILSVFHLSPIVVVLASFMFCAGTFSNYRMLKNTTYSFLECIVGKKKWFDGFYQYLNKYGELVELSFGKKMVLPILGLLGLSVGAAQVALVAGAMLSFSHLAGFSFLTVGIAGSIFWPIGIAIISGVLICFTALVFKEILEMLQEKSFKKALLRPFREFKESMDEIFSPENPDNNGISAKSLRAQKIITYIMLGFLCVISVGGLIALSYVSSLSMINVFTFLHMNKLAAVIISFTVGMGTSVIPEAFFQLASAAEAVRKIAVFFWEKFTAKAKEIYQVTIKPRQASAITLIVDGLMLASNFLNAGGSGWLVGATLHKTLIGAGLSFVLTSVTAIILGAAEFLNNALPVIAEEKEIENESMEKIEKVVLSQSYNHITDKLNKVSVWKNDVGIFLDEEQTQSDSNHIKQTAADNPQAATPALHVPQLLYSRRY